MTHRALVLAATLFATGTTHAAEPPPLVNVCWDYGCDRSERLVLPAAAWQDIVTLMRPAAKDPAGERRRVARAIARFEQVVGRRTGTHRDRHGNLAGSGRPGQLDCIDESRNTTGYLHMLAEHGLLRWHRVDERRRRAKWILDQHWTAVLVDRRSGRRWAVDSWFLDNGQQPYVQPLEAWLDKADLPANPDARERPATPPARFDPAGPRGRMEG